MKIVRFTLDEDLIAELDRAATVSATTRSAFVREALVNAIAKHREVQHRQGYEKAPEGQDEFSIWASEQVWPNEA
jgi:metal-responsive CopG/Arc/MetJ family transcriptional regulator